MSGSVHVVDAVEAAHRQLNNSTTDTIIGCVDDSDRDNNKDDKNSQLMRIHGIRFTDYQDESQLDHVMSLVGRDLSEPYSSTYNV
jgi:hypothetical protein